jgi:MFS family permease
MPPAHDPYVALRSRDYRRLLAGNMLASIASEMMSVAVGWELYQRTNSAAALGFVGLAQFLPVLLLALPAGHAADRYSRKGLFLAAQVMMALASLGLGGLSFYHGPVLLVYLCLLLTGVSRAFSAPARWALVPMVVPESALGNAVTWNSSGWQIASMLGPTLGGLVIGATKAATGAYVLAVAGSLGCAGLVASIRPQSPPRQRESVGLQSLLAGIRFVWKTRLILATITLDLFAVLLDGAAALLPIYARDILKVGATGLGLLRAAPSLGALMMALLLAHRPPLQHAGRTLLISVAGFGAATIVFGLSEDPALSFFMLALTGALDNISVVVRGTLVQLLTPDPMRGRVSAVNTIFIVSSNELGAFESGITAEVFGTVPSVVGGGIGTIVVVLAVALRWPEVLRLGSLQMREEIGFLEAEDRLLPGEEVIIAPVAASNPVPHHPSHLNPEQESRECEN